ncbi:glutamate decarboxylase [Serratia sp. (in: enterobacteria)]|uniref:glutamate decarboxylase n=1 Tax=Serratia sp. (in: enterobacteria) TaxID=616 RepID=UPI00398984CE
MNNTNTTPAYNENDDVYASVDLANALPKSTFPMAERNPRNVFNAIRDELMLDGNSRQNLATFCQTWVDDEIRELMDLSIDKNMIDKDEYPQTAEIEARCVRMLADLWNSPTPETTLGCSTIGSSEAAMLGGLALKWQWRKKRAEQGLPSNKPNLICGPVQICWHKFARYFDVELREIPLNGDRLIMNAEEVLKRVDENTIGVVPTLGVTFTCQYEPVKEVSDALDRLQQETGLDIPMHIDGASGAFLAPFCSPELEWDFRLPRVKSINSSGHKFGLAPLGAGWVIWREAADLPEELIFNVNYLGGNMPTFALNFSRPGGQIVAQYYNFLRLGREGYAKIHNACYATAQHLAAEIGNLGPFDILFDGDSDKGIPALAWKLKDGAAIGGYTLYDLAEKLRARGWQVPAYSMPTHREDLVIQRILVRHGVSYDLGCLLIEDIKRALIEFENHPVINPVSAQQGSGFNHG